MWIPAKQFLNRPTFNLESIKKNIRPTILLFLPQVAISLYVVFDRILLGLLRSYSDVGIYEQGQKLTSILLTVVNSLGAVMLSRVANLLSERREKEAQNMVRFSFILLFNRRYIYNIILSKKFFCFYYYIAIISRHVDYQILFCSCYAYIK